MSQRTPDVVVEAPSRLGLTPISRRSAKDSIVDEIRSSIMRGTLKAGVRIIEHKLAIDLNVSQTTVREALVDLEHLGFVQRVPPRKTFVTRLTHRDIDEIYSVRVPLEQVVIDLLATNATPDLTGAQRALEGMRRSAANEDRIQFESMDLEFHRALWAATGNRTLANILEKIVVKLFAFGFVMSQQIHASRPHMEEQAEQHGRILALIRSRDFQAARELMAASMDKTWLNDIEFLEETTRIDAGEPDTPDS
jgi:DNA-binding GntR family transcriptional regulator